MYPAAHSRVTWFGDAYGGDEIWQTGVRLAGTERPTPAEMQALFDAFTTHLWQAVLGVQPSHRVLGVKWAPQDTQGKYGDEGEAVELLPAPHKLSGGGTAYAQLAVVLSLRTDRARGYASNGRMYIPASPAIGTDGRILPGDADGMALSGANFVQAVNLIDLGDVAVMSAVGTGRSEAVTGVRVGRVVDTQRRRRNALIEEYTNVRAVPS